MPDIQAQSADGVTHSFPDGTKPEVIDRVMKQYAMSGQPQKAPAPIPGAPGGLPQPSPTPMPPGLPPPVATPGGATMNAAPTGANSNPFIGMGNAITGGQDIENLTQAGRAEHPVLAKVGDFTRNAKDYARLVGGTLGITGGAGLGGPAAAGEAAAMEEGITGSRFVKWLTASKSTGARMLEQAAQRAGNAPVAISPATDKILEQITAQGQYANVPKVITGMLDRLGPTTRMAAEAQPGPLTYNEARIIQSNLSDISASEKGLANNTIKGLMKRLAGSFSTDVQQAANAAGVGAEHAQGMSEYALASARNRALSKGAKYAAGTAGAAGAYELARKVLP